MKKIMLAVLAMVLCVSTVAFAEETEKGEMPGISQGASVDNPMGMPMQGMEKRCFSMMGKTQMVATDEGGVIVLAGNRLMKYDAELNLVKVAELQMPMGPMGNRQCPMMGKMMDTGAAPVAVEPQEKAIAPAVAESQEKTA